MNYSFLNKFTVSYILKTLCAILLFGYLGIGIFPLALYETDALGIITGCKKIIETGRFEENYFTYNFYTQPGIYFWTILLHKVLKVSLIESYSFISAFFGVAFVGAAAYFLSKLLQISFLLSSLSLFVFQGVYSAWFYMNSSTGAAFFMMAAFLATFIGKTPVWSILSGILLAISAWTRFDVIIIFPIILFLVPDSGFRTKVIRTVYSFISFTVVIVILCYFSNATNVLKDVLNGGGSLSFMDNQKTASSFFTSQFMRAFIGCFSLFSLVAISWGTWLLIRKGHNQQLLLFLFPVFLFSMFIVKHVVASKHFLYYIPFFAIPVAYTFNRVKTNLSRKDVIPLGILIFTFLMQYVLGVRISLPSHPYTNESYVSVRPDPLIFTLGTIKTPLKYIDSVTFVLGGGTKLSTSDEMLLSSGILFSPVMWYNLKHESNLEYDGISQFLDSVDADTVHITTSQGGVYPIKNLLYLNGFTLRNPESKLYKWGLDYSYTWQKPDKVVIVDQATYPKDNFEEYISKMNGHKYKNFIHVAFFDWERWYVNQYSQPHKKISSVAYLFTNPQPKLEESSQALTVK